MRHKKQRDQIRTSLPFLIIRLDAANPHLHPLIPLFPRFGHPSSSAAILETASVYLHVVTSSGTRAAADDDDDGAFEIVVAAIDVEVVCAGGCEVREAEGAGLG